MSTVFAFPVPWTLIVPIRDPATGKTRLNNTTGSLASAIAQDTLRAVSSTDHVGRVLLITDDAGWTAHAIGDLEIEVQVQHMPGLDHAIAEALSTLRSPKGANVGRVDRDQSPGKRPILPQHPTAVLLGDLPALRSEDLDSALVQAANMPLGFVPDAHGTGTTLVTALDPAAHRPHFGPQSAARHRGAGYREIQAAASLRCDVDTVEDLDAAAVLGLGEATSSLISAGRGVLSR